MPATPVRTSAYRRREPEKEPLYQVLAGHPETFLQHTRTSEHRLPLHVEKEMRAYLECGILAYRLTDVGPDDGGTCVIPGSHRLTWSADEMINAAFADDSLIHQVEAAVGSTLLFTESLLHSSTAIRSDKERTILIASYTPPMLREWPGNEVSPEFVETLPEEIKPLISGGDSWRWKRRY